MELIDQSYEGFYAPLQVASQKDGGLLMGADNIVGDDYEIVFKSNDQAYTAWVKNRFGAEVGYFDADTSRRLQLAKARGQSIRALLAFVAFSDAPEPGHYWGQMGLFCYNPAYAAEMDAFIDRCSERMADGVRPKIDLGSQAVQKIFSEPDWLPAETVPLPKKESGSAVLKDRRTMSEKVIEQGRAGNKGCYAISIAFIVVAVVAIAYFVAHAFGIL